MEPIQSTISGKVYALIELENELKPLGYVIGDNWDYDHGTFDYKLTDDGSYVYLRVPFTAVEGALDQDGCLVQLGEPFLLHHKYRTEDEQSDVRVGNITASFNQFQAPIEKDAEVPQEFQEKGRLLVGTLENILS